MLQAYELGWKAEVGRPQAGVWGLSLYFIPTPLKSGAGLCSGI